MVIICLVISKTARFENSSRVDVTKDQRELENHLTAAKISEMETHRLPIEMPIASIEAQSFFYFRSSISAYYEEHVRVYITSQKIAMPRVSQSYYAHPLL